MECLYAVSKTFKYILKRHSKLKSFVVATKLDTRRGLVRIVFKYCDLDLTIRLSCLGNYAVVLHDSKGKECLKWDNAPHHRDVDDVFLTTHMIRMEK